MPKLRGKYKQYLYDDTVKIPDRTKRYHKANQHLNNRRKSIKDNSALENTIDSVKNHSCINQNYLQLNVEPTLSVIVLY